jgi:type I restriction enzyme S subunit
MSKQINIPKLRFEGFDEGWEVNKINNLTNVTSGGTPSTLKKEYWNGNIPWMNSGELNLKLVYDVENRITELGLNKSSTKFIPKKSILIGLAGQGKTRGTAAMNMIELCINQSIGAILPNKEKFISEFLYLNIDSRYDELRKLSTGDGGRGGLNLQILKSLNVSIPTLPEQQKIASFLSVVDEKIQQLSRKKELLEQYKKGVMQQLFSGKLRFKDENGEDYADWKEKKLGDVAKRVTRKNKENNLNVLTISAQLGLVSQLEYFNKSVSAKDVTNYYLLERNDFAYNKSYSNGYPMGAIKRLKKYDKGVVSTLYICFCFNEIVSLNFMEQYFEFGLHNYEIEKVAQEGARNHGLLNIGVNDFLNIALIIPSLQEQQKIANFLSSIDTKIESTSQQINQTQSFKKGLLQQMFV